jgi:hypothetical protein
MKVAILNSEWKDKRTLNQCINENEIIMVGNLEDIKNELHSSYKPRNLIDFGFTLTKSGNYVISIDHFINSKFSDYSGFIKNLNKFERNRRKLKLIKLNELN